jgi:diacylglycerol O-acyltransferase / wax synthase
VRAASATPDPVPRRVLLVTGSLGAGHHAAARAIEERAHEVWPGVEVVWTDTLDGMGRHTATLFRAVYAGCVRHLPWLYALYFQLLWKVPPFRAATRAVIGAWSAPGLARQLARHDPDLVVATFPEGVTGLGRLRRRGRLDVPTVALVTDPAPHPLWADARLDLHLVSTAPGAALLHRAAPGASVRVAALPVSSRFRPPDVPARRDRPLVYVSCGSLAFGDLAAVCAAVLDAGADVLVSTGRAPAVRHRVDRLARSRPDGARMRVVDWVDDPAAATRGCDVVVTNAGGATALEAVACARPLLLVAPIPGHGRANARVLAAAGLATVCPGPAELTTAVRELRDPDRREAASRRLRCRSGDLAGDVAALAALRAGPAGPGPVLRAPDALFLYAATEAVPQQTGGRIVVDDPARRDDWPAVVAELVRVRAPQIPLLCRRVAPGRPGRRPRWVTDRHPDPRRHVRCDVVGIGALDGGPSWDEAVTRFFATRVDPVATGWELQVAQDRAAGQMAVLVRVHHSLGDGLAVTDALYRLLADDLPPAGPRRPAGGAGGHEQRRRRAAAPRALGHAALVVKGVTGLARAGRAGPSPLTGAVTGSRHIAVGLDGSSVRAVARRLGVGTTALLLAVVAEALHGLLADRGAGVAAGATVRAMVPMTARTRGGIDSRAPGNRTGAVPVDLPVGPMPPGERVARVTRAMSAGCAGGRPEAAAAVLVLLGLLPTRLQARLVRMVYGHRFFHILASVLPGLRRPVCMHGNRIREVYPVLPLADGVGLAVGALHWADRTCVGITVDPGIVPDGATLPRRIQAALAALEAEL